MDYTIRDKNPSNGLYIYCHLKQLIFFSSSSTQNQEKKCPFSVYIPPAKVHGRNGMELDVNTRFIYSFFGDISFRLCFNFFLVYSKY